MKGHQDKEASWHTIEELKAMGLLNSATLNIWCDHQAKYACSQDSSDPNIDVYALFLNSPVTHKVTGNLNYNILHTLHHEALEQFHYKKHGICTAKLQDINTNGLHALFKKSKLHQWATLLDPNQRIYPFIISHRNTHMPMMLNF